MGGSPSQVGGAPSRVHLHLNPAEQVRTSSQLLTSTECSRQSPGASSRAEDSPLSGHLGAAHLMVQGVHWGQVVQGVHWGHVVQGVHWGHVVQGVHWGHVVQGVHWGHVVQGVHWGHVVQGVHWGHVVQGEMSQELLRW